ncbi:MAG: hypothetical protein E2O39_17415 [Planctomycetota bacterium]|nr:MAG: hypothetical protein E2O39_17415 [Planctomycetota bacterium]
MTRFLFRALAAVCVLFALGYLALAFARVRYPFELEWQEGGMLDHVLRVLDGRPLYAEPSLEFIAFPYTPLYFHASALACKVFGVGLSALRIVSILASVACFALLFRFAQRAAGGALAGLFAIGLFAATYRFSGAWLDVGRVDSLFLALTLGGAYALRSTRGVPGAVIAAALLFLAFFTKQSALGVALLLFVPAVLQSRARGTAYALTFGLLFVGSTLWLEQRTGGWYRWYVFELLAGHAWVPAQVTGFWLELGAGVGLALAIVVWARLGLPRRTGSEGPSVLAFTALGLVLVAWVSRAHRGGYDNAFLPACAALAMLFGVAVERARIIGGRQAVLVGLAALLQLAWLAFDPRAQVPTAADRAAGERVVRTLADVAGPVFVPGHGYLARLAGKASCAHEMAINDLLASDDPQAAAAFVRSLESALEARRWSAIVLDQPWDDLPFLARYYHPPTPLFGTGDAFMPVTGAASRPALLYRAR